MKSEYFAVILIIFIILVCTKMFVESDYYNLSCIVSTVDGNKYCVRVKEKLNQQETVDLLARVTNKCKKLVKYLGKKYPERGNVKRLVDNFNPSQVKEILPTSEFTAYSENKGEKLAFCTTTKKKGGNLIDENTLTFVAIHELSHIASKTIGHNDEFWKNFKFLLQYAEKINIYKPIDYKKSPKNYCGMRITDNPYYDL